MSGRPPGREISWFWIIVGFMVFWPVGLALMLVKIFGESSARRAGPPPVRGYQPPGQSRTYRPSGQPASQASGQQGGWDWRQDAQTVQARPVREGPQQQQAPQAPPRPAAQAQPRPAPEGPHRYGVGADMGALGRLQHKISPNRGKGLWVGGWITAGTGALVAAIVLIAALASGERLLFATAVSALVAIPICGPGAAMAIVGGRKRERSERCQTLFTMMRARKNADIREMARAVPCSYGQACKDLRWMLHEGFFPGAYIDASKGMLIYAGFEPGEKAADSPAKGPAAPGEFPEVARIRRLNDEIADQYVSERLESLELLTYKILSYIEANPGKEDQARQFKAHYLPKTLKILESYARFERQGAKGANIQAAMKDVEETMDTLVSGFEKQLDMLFVDEALDVTTDINVLENMMGLSGLSSDDPFKLHLMEGDLFE